MGNSFRENLREELDYQDMTVKELSARIGVPKPTLDCYLSARQTIPPVDIAVKIAKELNVSVEFLVEGGKNLTQDNETVRHLNEISSKFMKLNKENQTTVIDLMNCMLKRQ